MLEDWFTGADGTKLYYRTTGNESGIPILLNDGIGCSGYVWKYLIPNFEDRYRIVHWNYKGHGKSDSPVSHDELGIPDLCRDLAELCRKLELPPAVVVGHSMGVQVTFEFWHMFPERVCALIPICGSYGNPLSTFHDNSLLKTAFPYLKRVVQYRPNVSSLLWEVITNSELAYQVATRFEVNGRMIRREDFKPYFEDISKVDAGLFVGMLGLAQEHDAKPYLQEIDVPTLIIGGEKDTFTPMWLSRNMKRLIPDAELLFVPEGSHTAPIEQPELINLRIEKFLRERVDLPEPSRQAGSAEKKAKAAPKKKKASKKGTKKQTETAPS